MRILVLALVFFIVLVATQDIQIFPGVLGGLLSSKNRDPQSLPRGVESIFVKTEDNELVETWRLPANGESSLNEHVAIIFHGNGGSVEMFFGIQQWFSSLGITSYHLDYRGYGKSSGWPSEKGIYNDADALWNMVREREKIGPEKIIIFGQSIGCGPATEIAKRYQPALLVLNSPYISIPELARERWLTRYLTKFLWYTFPTQENISKLATTNLIVAHGKSDNIIPLRHGESVAQSYQGKGSLETIFHEYASHNNLFFLAREKLAEAILKLI